MAHQELWLIEDRVILQHLSGDIDLAELSVALGIVNIMIDQSHEPLIHVIINVTQVIRYPVLLAKLAAAVKPLFLNPKLGWVIPYGKDDRIFEYLLSGVSSKYKVRFRSFKTQQEAFAFLNTVDRSLPDL